MASCSSQEKDHENNNSFGEHDTDSSDLIEEDESHDAELEIEDFEEDTKELADLPDVDENNVDVNGYDLPVIEDAPSSDALEVDVEQDVTEDGSNGVDASWQIVDSGESYEECEYNRYCEDILPEGYIERGCYEGGVYLQKIRRVEDIRGDNWCYCAREVTEVLLQEDCQSRGLSCYGGQCIPKYTRIEPGLLLGDEVSIPTGISRPFWMSTTEITQKDYSHLVFDVFGLFDDRYDLLEIYARHPETPVVYVSWLDAIRYTNLLSMSEGLPPCYDEAGNVIGGDLGNPYLCEGYRLPTETEWAYACQANTYGGLYCNGDRECFRQHEWIENDFRDGPYEVQWVAQRLPNNYGLYDMMGNVKEWIFDSFVDWGVYAEGIDNYIVNDYNSKKNNGMNIYSGVWGYTCLSDNDLSITQTTSTLGFRIVKTIFENNP